MWLSINDVGRILQKWKKNILTAIEKKRKQKSLKLTLFVKVPFLHPSIIDISEENTFHELSMKWQISPLSNLLFSFSFFLFCAAAFWHHSNITEDLFDDDIDEDDDKIQKNNFCSLNPTIILLQNVNREFLGNYSCRGYNSAGWGETSESQLLDVFHEPGNASVSVYPPIPIKGQSMVLTCVVDDPGNPKSTRFRWLQGDDLVKDIVTSEWTIYPVGLRNRNNYSCYAFNDGGNGTMATISINVNVPPKFIIPLLPYTGFLYSEPKIVLSCRIECVPNCTIYWFKNGDEITKSNELYTIKETFLPAHTSTADFESVSSELVSTFTLI